MDCPKTEGHNIEFAAAFLPIVLHNMEVVHQQLEDEEGTEFQVEVASVVLHYALLDQKPQTV